LPTLPKKLIKKLMNAYNKQMEMTKPFFKKRLGEIKASYNSTHQYIRVLCPCAWLHPPGTLGILTINGNQHGQCNVCTLTVDSYADTAARLERAIITAPKNTFDSYIGQATIAAL
jgi:hypothetical protein